MTNKKKENNRLKIARILQIKLIFCGNIRGAKFDANLKTGNSYHFENFKTEIPKKLSLITWCYPNNFDFDVTITKNTLIEFFETQSCSEEKK